MSTIWVFHHIENKHTLYRGKDCRKKFCESLREHLKNMIDFEKRNMLPLTKEELKSYQDAKVHSAAHSICNLKLNMSNEIPGVFQTTIIILSYY